MPLKEEYASELSSFLESIQIKLAENLKKKVNPLAVDRFFELLTLEKNEQKKKKMDICVLQSPHLSNWNEFFNHHVKLITNSKQAISTTFILNHFNKWLAKKGKSTFPSGVVHFGRLLSQFNPADTKWITTSGGKHLIQIV